MLFPNNYSSLPDTTPPYIHNVNAEEVLPTNHNSGTDNPADFLIKPRPQTDSGLPSDSVWHKGPDWMRLPTPQLPAAQIVTTPPNLEMPYNQEIFQEVVVSAADIGKKERDVLVAMTGQSSEVPVQDDPSLNTFNSQSPASTSSLLPHHQPRPPDTSVWW